MSSPILEATALKHLLSTMVDPPLMAVREEKLEFSLPGAYTFSIGPNCSTISRDGKLCESFPGYAEYATITLNTENVERFRAILELRDYCKSIEGKELDVSSEASASTELMLTAKDRANWQDKIAALYKVEKALIDAMYRYYTLIPDERQQTMAQLLVDCQKFRIEKQADVLRWKAIKNPVLALARFPILNKSFEEMDKMIAESNQLSALMMTIYEAEKVSSCFTTTSS